MIQISFVLILLEYYCPKLELHLFQLILEFLQIHLCPLLMQLFDNHPLFRRILKIKMKIIQQFFWRISFGKNRKKKTKDKIK